MRQQVERYHLLLAGTARLGLRVPDVLALGVQTPSLCFLGSGHAGLCWDAPNLAHKFLVTPFDTYLVMLNLDCLQVMACGHAALCHGAAYDTDDDVVAQSESCSAIRASPDSLREVLSGLADRHLAVSN